MNFLFKYAMFCS